MYRKRDKQIYLDDFNQHFALSIMLLNLMNLDKVLFCAFIFAQFY